MTPDAERLLRELAPQALGSLIRRFRDFSACEDALQEALLAAFTQWPRDGIPEQPLGWLIQVAARRLTDQIRSDSARRRRESAAALPEVYEDPAFFGDLGKDGGKEDTLLLLFMCCHEALSPASAIALTLRAVGGLTTSEIASAFLVPEATMGQRISRAKQTIKASGIPFRLPTAEERAERLRSVLHVLYLIFNEGYTSTAGSSLHRPELSSEAIRLTRAVQALLPSDAEVMGLLGLMLLTDARRTARTGTHGELIPLTQQDRGLWNQAQIEEGIALVSAALPLGAIGPYQLQAAIAAVHDEARQAQDTDWPQILALYDLLKRMDPGPMVALNHAVATAMVRGPWVALQMLDQLAALKGHHRLAAVRAHLLEMAGESFEARNEYLLAASLATSLPEKNYLITQAARLAETDGQDPVTVKT